MQGRLAAEVDAPRLEARGGGVHKATRKEKADQQKGRLEHPPRDNDGADEPAGADQGWLRAIHLPQSPLPGPDQGMVDRRDPWIALAAELGDGDPDRLWRNLLDVAAQRLADGLRVLVGDEATAELGGDPGRNDRLLARPLIAAPDPVDVQRWPRPVAFGGSESRLALQGPQTVGPLYFRLIKGNAGELAPLLVAERPHAVVETGHQDVAGWIFEVDQDLRQRLGGVGRDAAEVAGVEIGVGRLDPELEVDHAAERVGDRGESLCHHRRVADDAVVRLEPIAVGAHERLEIRAPDLFFAFGDHLEVDGQLPGRAKPGVNRLPVERDLPFVIGCSAPEKQPVLLARLERWRGPEAEWVHRLNVIVPVEQHGGRALRL